MGKSFRATVWAARREGGLYFAALLSEKRISEAVREARAGWRGWVYTPSVTVWVFLSQCLSADHSCREAVARLLAWRVSRGGKPCSAETGAYCTAREHLPEAACRQLMRGVGQELDRRAPDHWLWKGRRLGTDDHVVSWPKPQRPEWMDAATYEQLPELLIVREIRVRVTRKGFRTKRLLLVTTLLSAAEYSHDELADVYRRRWQIELNLRSLKTVMEMDHLRCRTPHRVRNEFFMHLLAYNLVRQVMSAAALATGVCPF